jgi:fucose permease
MPAPARDGRAARAAVSLVFCVNGLALASWVPHVPAVKRAHGLTDGALGAVLLCMAVGALVALSRAGGVVARLGSRRATAVAALALVAALPGPLLAPSVPLLALALLGLGAANATLDVAMNAQAVEVERRRGRALMSSFHALFSLGGLAGAAAAGAAVAHGVPPAAHLAATALGAAAALAWALRALPAAAPPADTPAPALVRPAAALVPLGALAFCGLLTEGAVADWSAVYLHDTLGGTRAVAAAGFAACSLAMATGRLAGDRLVGRFGAPAVLRASSAVAAAGLAGALLRGDVVSGVVGFGLVGLGIANVIPILFSAAGRVPGTEPGAALAAVGTTGYVGFLAGPPVIGLAADATGLRVALGLVALLCAATACAAGVVRPHDRRPLVRRPVLIATLAVCIVTATTGRHAAARVERFEPRLDTLISAAAALGPDVVCRARAGGERPRPRPRRPPDGARRPLRGPAAQQPERPRPAARGRGLVHADGALWIAAGDAILWPTTHTGPR